MQISDALLLDLFARSLSLWWVIVPGMLLGLLVGIVPGFSAQNTLIILLPLTLHMSIEAGTAFMIGLYCTSQLGLIFKSVEMVVVMVFGLTLIAAIAAKDLLKGLIAGFTGLMIGAIGADPVYGTARATFGFLELYDGVPLIPALIGLFAISEAFEMLEREAVVRSASDLERAKSAKWSDTLDGLRLTL